MRGRMSEQELDILLDQAGLELAEEYDQCGKHPQAR